MPDGSRYDGRYNLVFEILHLPISNVNPDNPTAVADFYGVPLDTYLAGQEWARQNLAGLREGVMRESRLRYGKPLDMVLMAVLRDEWQVDSEQ